MISKIRRLAALLVFSAPFLHALEFRVVSWEGSITDVFYLDAAKQITLKAHKGSISRPYTKTGAVAPLVLFKDVTTPEGQTVRQTLATIPLPPASEKSAILMLAKLEQPTAEGERLMGRWLEDDCKAGTVSFFNFCSKPLAIKTKTGQWALSPGERHVADSGAEAMSVELLIGAQIEGEWKLVSNTSMPMRPQLHAIVLLRDAKIQPGGPDSPIELVSIYTVPPVPLVGVGGP